MASGMYDIFKADLMGGHLDLDAAGDTIKVMLLDSNHTFTSTHDTKADIVANEISGTGYTAGGATLANQAVTEGASTKWDADDVEWTGATFTARYAVIYDTTVSDNLIACIDFVSDKSVTAGTFKIQWHANGIITLATVEP